MQQIPANPCDCYIMNYYVNKDIKSQLFRLNMLSLRSLKFKIFNFIFIKKY